VITIQASRIASHGSVSALLAADADAVVLCCVMQELFSAAAEDLK